MEINIMDFGAKIGTEFDNSSIIQSAIDKCSHNGGGKIIFPSNTILTTGPFEIKSNIHLHFEQNSEIIAHPNEEKYNLSAFKENEGEGTVWIYANHAQNIQITGMGCINGNDTAFLGEELSHSYVIKPFTNKDYRPHVMILEGCKKVTIRDITLKKSCYWCLHLAGCEDVVISGIRIENSLKVRNSDGIDIDHSKNVRISDCYIQSGDDCICLKNRREYNEYGDCENITINNCIMISTSCSFKIGSENVNAIRNVVVSNCIITKSNRGIGIQNRDEGTVENVLFNNIIVQSRLFHDVWWGKAEPIYVTAFRRAAGNNVDQNWRFAKGQKQGKVGKVSNIKFVNCNLEGENGIFIAGEEGKIEDIKFSDIDIKIEKISKYEGGYYDSRPCLGEGLFKSNNSGVYIEQAQDIFFTNIHLQWGKNLKEYYTNALIAKKVNNLVIKNFNGKSAHNDIDKFEFVDSKYKIFEN